jgi:hypothetical protein
MCELLVSVHLTDKIEVSLTRIPLRERTYRSRFYFSVNSRFSPNMTNGDERVIGAWIVDNVSV